MIEINKIDKVVLKEAAFVGAWILIFSALMEAVFLIIGKWNYTVLLGNILSGAIGALNFLLLGMTVQKALASGDPKRAGSMMKVSQLLRLLLVAGVCVLGATLDCFNLWATLIPLLFPRIAMIIRQIMLRKVTKAVKAMTAFSQIAGGVNDGEAHTSDETDVEQNVQENESKEAKKSAIPKGGEAIE